VFGSVGEGYRDGVNSDEVVVVWRCL